MKIFLKPTLNDYLNAEEIILDQSDLYDLSGMFLKQKEGKRFPNIEAALIDILMSYDNEGGRVILKNMPSAHEGELRQRLQHIRRHTDEKFLTDDLDRYNEILNESEYLINYHGFIGGDEYPFDPNGEALLLMEAALEEFDRLREEHPQFKEVDWKKDTAGVYYTMLKDAGLTGKKRIIPKQDTGYQIGTTFSLGDIYSDILLGALDNTFEFDGYPVWIFDVLPLLRETEQDELLHDVKINIMKEGLSSQEIEKDFPACALHLKRYQRRLEKMKQERPSLEEELAAYSTSNLTNRDLSSHKDFAQLEKITLYVDPLYKELVQRIIEGRSEISSLQHRERSGRRLEIMPQ